MDAGSQTSKTAETEARALRAAAAVATGLGARTEDSSIIAAGSNVLVLLRPVGAVARVMTGTADLREGDLRVWLEREVAVAQFAADRGAPVVAPSGALPPGPHERDGLWMTFWEPIDHDPSLPVDPEEVGRSLRALHDALADYPGELRPLRAVHGEIERLIHQAGGPDAHARHAELRRLLPIVFEGATRTQALHGDVTIGNTLRTPAGLLWNDFEDVCRGPVEWDVAGLLGAAEVRGLGDDFADAMLAGYGWTERAALEPFLEAHMLYVHAWQATRPDATPQ